MKKENKRKLNLGDIIRKMSEDAPGSERCSENQPPCSETENSTALHRKDNSFHTVEQPMLPPQPRAATVLPQPAEQPGHNKTGQEPPVNKPDGSASHAHHNSQIPAYVPPVQPLNTLPAQQSYDEDNEEQFDFFRYISVIIRRKEVIVLAAIVMGLFSTFSYLKSAKYYTAHTRLLFRPNQETIIDNRPAWQASVERDRNFNTHLELLRSSTVVEQVSKNLDNRIDPRQITVGLKIIAGETRGEETNIIELMFKHTDAEITRDVCNELANTYIEYRRDVNAQEDTRLILKLKVQIDKVQNELTLKENTLRTFKEENKMIELSQEANLLVRKLADMEISLQQTQLGLLESKERLTTLKSQINLQDINIVQSMTYENPIRSRLAELELEMNTLSGEYSSDHFKIKQINQQINNLKEAMQSEIENEIRGNAVKETLVKNPIRESLLQTFVNQNIEISALDAKRIAQEQIIEKLKGQMYKLPSIEQDFAFLERETESLLKTLKMLKIKYEETKISRDSKESELKILELAKLPKRAISEKKISSIFIGLFIGVILGIALAFFLEYLDQSIKEPGDMEKYLEIPLIGLVPLIETDNAIVENDNLTKTMLEPFRALRTNIKQIAANHNAKLFMICSAVKGEGKTTLAVNLAITFALDGKKVILVDCDLRRSQIHSLLNIPKEIGLSDYLLGSKNLDEIIKPTRHANLYLITSGERPTNPAELLGIPAFSQMLQELRNKADFILCDSPAMIPVSDTMTMASHMDCCILVVRALWTPLKAAKQTKTQLTRIGTRLVGGILNGISHSRGYYPYYYGYYGYYAYKYSYDYDKESPKKLTVRELGLLVERKAKTFFQFLPVLIPRYLSLAGKFFKQIMTKLFFWVLIALLIAIIIVRFVFFSPPDGQDSSITYLGENQSIQQQNQSPITVIPHQDHSDATFSERQKQDMEPVNPDTSLRKVKPSSFAYQESLSVWVKALAVADTSRFLLFYDKDNFVPSQGSYDEWRQNRISNLLKNGVQEFMLSLETINAENIKDDVYTTSFTLAHARRSDTLFIRKTLLWRCRDDAWRIIREKDSP